MTSREQEVAKFGELEKSFPDSPATRGFGRPAYNTTSAIERVTSDARGLGGQARERLPDKD